MMCRRHTVGQSVDESVYNRAHRPMSSVAMYIRPSALGDFLQPGMHVSRTDDSPGRSEVFLSSSVEINMVVSRHPDDEWRLLQRGKRESPH